EGEVWLEIPQGTSYQEFRLKNKGVPHLNGFGRGNQIVMIKVKIPKSLTREQKRLLEELKEGGL
ncbi:molecular chaperone DnaJ, partial [Candidatus Kuenenbacteria bacterium]|nr:molecular chaperone DnaJ [Candidatus Kuenenbacteria bacterium]